MSTLSLSPELTKALGSIPTAFSSRLIKHYLGVHIAYVEAKYDNCGQHAGKFCEVLLRYLQDQLTGTFIPFGQKIGNFKLECEKLENTPVTQPESMRLVIPRGLSFLYTMRNKRDIGHVGGDVDANRIDSATYSRLCDWCMSELIRVVHSLSLEEAQELLDTMSVRQVPQIWSVAGKYRVLEKNMNFKDKSLLLLYSTTDTSILAEDLWTWTKHTHFSHYKRDVLRPLDKDCLIEFDTETDSVILSPKGAEYVEQKLLKTKG